MGERKDEEKEKSFGTVCDWDDYADGRIVLPFIVGIIWLFLNVDSIGAKLLTGIGVVIILASIISNLQFVFRGVSLYVYLVMLILIFGGQRPCGTGLIPLAEG